ncbi:MAG: site-specific integrase [Candidatus Bathyarchaeota archaeon]|nr:site-specific integrase [Candidatus Bathyarchaeota archaeon]
MTAYDEIRDKYFNESTHRSLPPRDQFYVLMAKLDTLENKLEFLINKVIDEINNGSKSKDLPLNRFFSRFCVLKGLDENHPTAGTYKSRLNLFFKFLGENYPKVGNLKQLKPIMISEFVRYLKARQVYLKRYKKWEKMSDRTVNSHIRGLRYVLEVVDKVGTQELREPLIPIKRPHSRKNPYIPTDEELARVPKLLKKLRQSRREDYQYLAFIAATVLQFCGRTNALSELRFDMIEGLEGEKPTVSYIGKHRVEQVKGITNEWYRDFLKEWKEYVQQRYGNMSYFFPAIENGQMKHISDQTLRLKFKEFMQMCELPQLTVHSFRYIYATKLYLKGVSPDAIKDILGVDKRTLRYYIKAVQERKKKVLFTHLEKVSALPKDAT